MINLKKKQQQQCFSTSQTNTPAATQLRSNLSKKRNSQIAQHNQEQLQPQPERHNIHGGGQSFTATANKGISKQVNNFMIEPQINANQIIQQHKTKQHSQSTKSSSNTRYGGSSKTQNATPASATNKVSASFQSAGAAAKFGERRLSTKIIEQHRKSHGGKNAIQYENLMLQQLMKQHQLDIEKSNASSSNPAYKKNLSVISIDQQMTQNPTQQNLTPHMMLNISYNMNNNINHHSHDANAAQFLFQQDPAQIKTLIGLTGDQQDPQAMSMAADHNIVPYKTQIDAKQKKNSVPYSGNSSMLEGMSYENSIVQAVKNGEHKFRDQSFDKLNHNRQQQKKQQKRQQQQQQQQSSSTKRSNPKQQFSSGSSARKAYSKHYRQQLSNSRSNSSNKRSVGGTGKQYKHDSSSRVVSSSNGPTSSHSNNSSKRNFQKQKRGRSQQYEGAGGGGGGNTLENLSSYQQMQGMSVQQQQQQHPLQASSQAYAQVGPGSFNREGRGLQQEQEGEHILNIKAQRDSNDRILLEKLDEALTRDLKDKSSAHRVGICSKVLAEIIRREDSVIASLLTKIKQSYESHIKSQNKTLAQQQKEINFEQELKNERAERKNAETKIENLSQELKKQQQCIDKQDQVISDMKKQILQYRQEIIQLSTGKKGGNGKKHGQKQAEMDRDMKIPRLDLSKVQRDSDEESKEDSANSGLNEEGKAPGSKKDMTYQQYLKFLENESRFEDMGEESQESLMRQEELKQRKNRIIQLLNGEISDEEEGGEGYDLDNQSDGEERDDNPEGDDGDLFDIDEQILEKIEGGGDGGGDGASEDISLCKAASSNSPQKAKDLAVQEGGDTNLKKKHQQAKQTGATKDQKEGKKLVVRDFGEEDHQEKEVMVRSFT